MPLEIAIRDFLNKINLVIKVFTSGGTVRVTRAIGGVAGCMEKEYIKTHRKLNGRESSTMENLTAEEGLYLFVNVLVLRIIYYLW